VQIDVNGDTTLFNTELTRTLGMEIVDGNLFDADFTGVVGLDLATDQIVMTIPITGMNVLNDVTADSFGYLSLQKVGMVTYIE